MDKINRVVEWHGNREGGITDDSQVSEWGIRVDSNADQFGTYGARGVSWTFG